MGDDENREIDPLEDIAATVTKISELVLKKIKLVEFTFELGIEN